MNNLLNFLRQWMNEAPQGQTREATVQVRGDGLTIRLEMSERPINNLGVSGFVPWPQIDAAGFDVARSLAEMLADKMRKADA